MLPFAPNNSVKFVLQNTSLAHRPYDVSVSGEASNFEWILIAAHTYAVLLEAGIGTPSRVVKCFEAWEKEMTSGIRAMSAKQIADAGTWRLATAHAQRVAGQLLSYEPQPVFTFRMK